ncbi:MAG: hypothetical protein JWN38_796 [Candidatus Saccharibacteria bacterium]|nr:hypothetical protein [Candidatus Saccharibacteria bacterium]
MPDIESQPLDLQAPQYWDDYDIHDDATFLEAEQSDIPYPLSRLNYRLTKAFLGLALGEVARGNGTEVNFGAGTEYGSTAAEYSLVVVESESLTKMSARKKQAKLPMPHEAHPAFERPYSHYWANNQPRLGAQPLGKLRMQLDDGLSYGRDLRWGVVTTSRHQRVIQPFAFDGPLLLPNGIVKTARGGRINALLDGSLLPLPIAVGKVAVQPRIEARSFRMDVLERVRAIEVAYVWPSGGSNGGKRVFDRAPARARFGFNSLPAQT